MKSIVYTISGFCLLCLTCINCNAQITGKHSPSAQMFTPVTVNSLQSVTPPNQTIQYYQHPSMPMGAHADDIIEKNNQAALKNMGYPDIYIPKNAMEAHQHMMQEQANYARTKKQQQIAQVKAILAEQEEENRQANPLLDSIPEKKPPVHYQMVFNQLVAMYNGKSPFSLKKAVFLIENAWHDHTLNYDSYSRQITIKANLLKNLMKKEGFSTANHLAKNYTIQKLFSERIVEFKDTVAWRVHKPFAYDFEDFMGEKDWSKMFVTKLLTTGKGQCHSLPLLYLILAEEVNAQAWLSLAPEHSFIIFGDENKRMFFNYETTSGHCVTTNWLMESSYISSLAIKNRIYLDTLGKAGLMATLLTDLVMGYINKYTYDDFTLEVVRQLLTIYPGSVRGQILLADHLLVRTKHSIRKAGNPPLEKLKSYPKAYSDYNLLMQQYEIIDRMGYSTMPKDQYEKWLQTIEQEKHKQANKQIKTRVVGYAKAGK